MGNRVSFNLAAMHVVVFLSAQSYSILVPNTLSRVSDLPLSFRHSWKDEAEEFWTRWGFFGMPILVREHHGLILYLGYSSTRVINH